MTTIAKEPEGGDFEIAPAGTFVARCYRFIDLGTQHNKRWDQYQRKCLIMWELPTEKMEDGRPFSVGTRYTLSLSEKAYLRRDLESWRGKAFTDQELLGFDVATVVGAPCMINIIHNTDDGKTYANVGSVMALPKGTECPPAINPKQVFDIDAPDMEMFESFSDGLKKVIQESQEWPKEEPAPTIKEFDDDVPF